MTDENDLVTPSGGAPMAVVGIGASAGGLEALEAFFTALSATPDMAFVVVQHLSPDYRSMMVELLTRRTHMRVVQASDGEPLLAGTVYLNSPGKLLALEGERFVVSDLPPGHRIAPIDYFLGSLALNCNENAAAVVLSGTGTDGARGAAEVRARGGCVLVQSPKSAAFDGMPRACLASGKVDLCAPPAELAHYLSSGAFLPGHVGQPADGSTLEVADSTLGAILIEVARESGIDFSLYRKNSLRRRIERRVARCGVKSAEEYLLLLRSDIEEVQTLCEEFLIGVTSFFRDAAAYEELEQNVLMPMLEAAEPNAEVRIWSVGCSTGEEPYSLAIACSSCLEKLGKEVDVKIFASDVNPRAIQFASRGIYPGPAVRDIPERHRALVPPPVDGSLTIPQRLRSRVVFAVHNVLIDPPFAKTDLVVCRNVLIYFEPQLQARALDVFAFSIKPGGALFLGASESVGVQAGTFEPLSTYGRLFRSARHRKRAPLLDNLHGRSTSLGAFGRSALNTRTLESLLEALATRIAPAGVAVGGNFEPVHVFGDVTPYLAVPRGTPSLNLLKMARGNFATTLGAAVGKARQTGEEVSYRSSVGEGETQRPIVISVMPLLGSSVPGGLTLVFFREAAVTDAAPAPVVLHEMSADARSRDLETELMHTRESLQGLVEELETSNEELQSTNEELLASNEELQSTNEELQAVNEELYTVNSEFQAKLRELDQLNNDLSNVLDSADISLILLDQALLLRRFTALAAAALGIRSSDIGRALTELALGGASAAIVEAAKAVVKGASEQTCQITLDGHRWSVRASPYRNALREVDGAVVVMTS